jgi:hypothetical protein
MDHRFWSSVAVSIAILGAGPAPPAQPAPPGAGAEGLWQGSLITKRAELEADVIVELSRDANGKWVGTLDVPNQKLKFHPLENVKVEGSTVSFDFNRFAKKAQVMVETPFTGTLSADGSTLSGDFFEGRRTHYALTLTRIGPAGGERPEPRMAELHALADNGAELREQFNRDAGKTRLVLLLSPT